MVFVNLPQERTVRYWTKVVKGGRVVIPRSVVKTLSLKKGDYLQMIVRKIQKKDSKILFGKKFTFAGRLSSGNMITIPADIRSKIGLGEDGYVQIEILAYSYQEG